MAKASSPTNTKAKSADMPKKSKTKGTGAQPKGLKAFALFVKSLQAEKGLTFAEARTEASPIWKEMSDKSKDEFLRDNE